MGLGLWVQGLGFVLQLVRVQGFQFRASDYLGFCHKWVLTWGLGFRYL